MEYTCRQCKEAPVRYLGLLCRSCSGKIGKNNIVVNPNRVGVRDPLPQGSPCLEGMTHHWVIDPPGGTSMLGHCKNCKELRDFYTPDEAIALTKTDKGGLADVDELDLLKILN